MILFEDGEHPPTMMTKTDELMNESLCYGHVIESISVKVDAGFWS